MMAIYSPYRSHSSTTPRGGTAFIECNWQEGEQAEESPLTARARTFVDRQPVFDFRALIETLAPFLTAIQAAKGRRVNLLDLHAYARGEQKSSGEASAKSVAHREWRRRRKQKIEPSNLDGALTKLRASLDAIDK